MAGMKCTQCEKPLTIGQEWEFSWNTHDLFCDWDCAVTFMVEYLGMIPVEKDERKKILSQEESRFPVSEGLYW